MHGPQQLVLLFVTLAHLKDQTRGQTRHNNSPEGKPKRNMHHTVLCSRKILLSKMHTTRERTAIAHGGRVVLTKKNKIRHRLDTNNKKRGARRYCYYYYYHFICPMTMYRWNIQPSAINHSSSIDSWVSQTAKTKVVVYTITTKPKSESGGESNLNVVSIYTISQSMWRFYSLLRNRVTECQICLIRAAVN